MDNMIKNAPMSGGMSDSSYDRSEDAEVKMQTCPDCKGETKIYYSCCNDVMLVDDEICPTCKEICFPDPEECLHCNDEGEVEI